MLRLLKSCGDVNQQIPERNERKNEIKKKKKKKITLGEIIVFITAIGEMIVNENKKRKAGNQNEISN